MNVLVHTIDGAWEVDLETEELAPASAAVDRPPDPVRAKTPLPRVVAAAAAGATVVAAVDARPPLLVSHDAGVTWRETGRGLPPGRAVAISDENPDVVVFAARNRLYVSRDGGRFWGALALELPEILGVELA